MRKTFFCALFIFTFACQAESGNTSKYEQTVLSVQNAIRQLQKFSESLPGYQVTLRRDPNKSLIDSRGKVTYAAGLHEGLMIQGIVWAEDYKAVLVNDEFYIQGDYIGPYRVFEVKRDGFEAIDDNGKKTFIPLYPDRGLQEGLSP